MRDSKGMSAGVRMKRSLRKPVWAFAGNYSNENLRGSDAETRGTIKELTDAELGKLKQEFRDDRKVGS